MPNWVFNSLTIEGSPELISKVKEQLNKPFERLHDTWNPETHEQELRLAKYSNPIFALGNIYSHRDMGITDEEYSQQPIRSELDVSDPNWWADCERLRLTDKSWYSWNITHWGTKWDTAVSDTEEYPDTELMTDTEDTLVYRFNTAWAPPIEAIAKLSAQYPDLELDLEFEEESGWGGNYLFSNGQGSEIESYENKCRECDSINTVEYCDNGCGEICNDCNYMGEADLECVAECDTHKVYLDDQHVPEYRRVEI